MTAIYYFYDTNAEYLQTKSDKKISPYLKRSWKGMGRTLYPQVFTQIAHVRRHLESNDYTAFGGVVLIRLDIDSGFKNYLIATAETCKACNQILHHAVGVEVYCSNPRCPDAIESFI